MSLNSGASETKKLNQIQSVGTQDYLFERREYFRRKGKEYLIKFLLKSPSCLFQVRDISVRFHGPSRLFSHLIFCNHFEEGCPCLSLLKKKR